MYAIDERARRGVRGRVAGAPMPWLRKSAAGRGDSRGRAEVLRQRALGHVLEHADARDLVERARLELAVVAHLDAAPVLDARRPDALARELRPAAALSVTPSASTP